MTPPRRPALALFVLVSALYAGGLRNGFVYDDHEVILMQPAPRGVGDVVRMFLEPHGLPLSKLPYYRAVPRASLLVQKAIHGDAPAPFHAVNALLGGAAAAVVFALLRTPAFGLGAGPAFAGAALFGAHPILSACVHPIASGRETLLPAVLALAAVALWLRRARAGATACFALALLGKEQAIVLPAALAWADLLGMSGDPPGRSVRRWLVRFAPLVLVIAGYASLRAAIFGIALSRPGDTAPAPSPAAPVLSLLFAIQSVFLPFVALRYEPQLASWWSPLRSGLSLLAFLALVLDGARASDAAWRRRTLFWVGWFVLLLLPSLNLVRQEAPFDERFVLLSGLGVAALAASALARRAEGTRARLVASAACAVLALVLAGISFGRGATYHDPVTFQRQWAETSPGHANARVAYGTALLRAGDTDAARAELEAAVRLAPADAVAHFNLAVLLAQVGAVDEAAREFRVVLQLDPGDAEARANLAVLDDLMRRRDAARPSSPAPAP